jgi:hypothetical protein
MKITKKNITAKLTLIAVAILFTSNIMAQKKAEIGFRFMPTISNFDVNTSTGGKVSGEATLGYGVGFLLAWNFSKNVSVQGEITYSSISQKYKEVDIEHKVSLKYINIPLLLSLNTNKYGQFNLNLVAGPQLGLNVGSSVTTTGGDGTYTSNAIVSIKKGDIGIAYGLGFDFAMNDAKTTRLGIGYRAVQGLIDISDHEKSTGPDTFYVINDTRVKTQAIYIGVSLLF